MKNQLIIVDQEPIFVAPPEADLSAAIQKAFVNAGPELFKDFINGYKLSLEELKQFA